MIDYRYIVALVSAGVFFLAFVVYICSALRNRYLENKRAIRQYEIYSDPNLVKMDYDLAYYDEASPSKTRSRADVEMQVSVEDLINAREMANEKFTPFAKIEDEEIEEITGTYKP